MPFRRIKGVYRNRYVWQRGLNRRGFVGGKARAVLTGTITASVTEADIVTGGKTLIITLTGDTWIAAGAGSFDLQRQAIINGCTSAQSEALGWNPVPKALQTLGPVVRTSDTVVTITWDAFSTYNITAQETITVTVPASALTGAVAIVATPTFAVATAPVLRSIAGIQPSASGSLTRKLQAKRTIAGIQPAASGALARILKAKRALAGVQPAASGALTRIKRALRMIKPRRACGPPTRSSPRRRRRWGSSPSWRPSMERWATCR